MPTQVLSTVGGKDFVVRRHPFRRGGPGSGPSPPSRTPPPQAKRSSFVLSGPVELAHANSSAFPSVDGQDVIIPLPLSGPVELAHANSRAFRSMDYKGVVIPRPLPGADGGVAVGHGCW